MLEKDRANGLLRPAPSNATLSGWVAKAMRKSAALPTRARPAERQRRRWRPSADCCGKRRGRRDECRNPWPARRARRRSESCASRYRRRCATRASTGNEIIVRRRPAGRGRRNRTAKRRPRGAPAEIGDARSHLRLIEVDARASPRSPAAFSVCGDVLGVVGRIGERGNGIVGAVADHQRDARLGPGGGPACQSESDHETGAEPNSVAYLSALREHRRRPASLALRMPPRAPQVKPRAARDPRVEGRRLSPSKGRHLGQGAGDEIGGAGLAAGVGVGVVGADEFDFLVNLGDDGLDDVHRRQPSAPRGRGGPPSRPGSAGCASGSAVSARRPPRRPSIDRGRRRCRLARSSRRSL